MNEDDFKRASLRGRGWKIMRGEDKSPQDESQSDASVDEIPSHLQLTPEEIDDVLDSVPPPLGTMQPTASDAPIFDDVFSREESASGFFAGSRSITSEAFDQGVYDGDEVEESFYRDDKTDFDTIESTYEAELLPLDETDEEGLGLYNPFDEPTLEDSNVDDVMATKEASRASITGIFDAEEFIPDTPSEDEQVELESEISDMRSLSDMLMTEELHAEDLNVYQSEALSATELASRSGAYVEEDEDQDDDTEVRDLIFGSDDFLDDSGLDDLELEKATPDPELDDPYGTTQFDPYETTQVDMVVDDDLDPTFIPLGDEVDLSYSVSEDDAEIDFEEVYEDEPELVQREISRTESVLMMEAIPSPEDTESVDAVDLSHEVRAMESIVETLVPETPEVGTEIEEQPDPAFGAFNLFDEADDEVFESEGAGPSGSSRTREGMPLVEDLDKPRAVQLQNAKRQMSAIHSLAPLEPEVRSKGKGRNGVQVIEDEGSGGIYVDEEMQDTDIDVGLESPFGRQKARPKASDLFTPTRTPDGSLLDQFVDDTKLRELWDLIEALQEDVVEQITGDRERTDIYQQELLIASGLLLESRENYDDARAIAYRIRADLNRDRQVAEAIHKHRGSLLMYIAGWGIGLVMLGLLNGAATIILEDAKVPFFAAAYLPVIFGAGGGLFLAYSTLHKHTSIRRDFDPVHLPWYFFSPMVGGLMGFLVFLISAAVVKTTVTEDITNTATLGGSLIWALAFIGGIQQNWVISQLQSLRGRIRGDSSED